MTDPILDQMKYLNEHLIPELRQSFQELHGEVIKQGVTLKMVQHTIKPLAHQKDLTEVKSCIDEHIKSHESATARVKREKQPWKTAAFSAVVAFVIAAGGAVWAVSSFQTEVSNEQEWRDTQTRRLERLETKLDDVRGGFGEEFWSQRR